MYELRIGREDRYVNAIHLRSLLPIYDLACNVHAWVGNATGSGNYLQLWKLPECEYDSELLKELDDSQVSSQKLQPVHSDYHAGALRTYLRR